MEFHLGIPRLAPKTTTLDFNLTMVNYYATLDSPSVGREDERTSELEALEQLVLDGHLSGKGVVRVPLLREGEAVVFDGVLGLKGAKHLARFLVGGAARVELHSRVCFCLAVQLE